MRVTLIGLVGLVALSWLLPALASAVGFQVSWSTPSSTTAPNSTKAFAQDKPTKGSCANDGVTLVVDPGADSGKAATAYCALNFSGTGWQLFAQANVSVEGTQQYPGGFVCRINGYPTSTMQDCAETPTTKQGTWVYFNAQYIPKHKSTWRFSMQGAATRRPSCGSVDGWVFVRGGNSAVRPRIAPTPFDCQR